MRNRVGIHALVWVGGWSQAEARKAIASSARAGFDLIELAALDPEAFDARLTASLLAEYGLAAAVSLGLDGRTDVSSDDDAIVAAGRARLALALRLVRDIGGDYLGGVIYSRLGRYTRPVTARGRANSIASIAWLADEAAASGITLGLEFCNRYETNVLNTTADTLRFIDEVGRDNVVAHPRHLPHEPFSSAVVHPALSSNLSIWRDLWTDSMALATGARAFIRDRYGV
jgi:D-psicose/D-tagatose/L-ribulose 3-epimerase